MKANLIYQSSDEKQKNTWFIFICFSLACPSSFVVPCLPMKHTPVGVCKTCNSPGFLLKNSSISNSEVLISFMDHNFTFHLNSPKQVNGASTQTITSDTNRISLEQEMFNFSSCIADHPNSLTPEKIQTRDLMDANRPRWFTHVLSQTWNVGVRTQKSLPLETAPFLKGTWTSTLSGAPYKNILARKEKRYLQREPKLWLEMPQWWQSLLQSHTDGQ